MGKVILKGIIVVLCAIALIWNAFQLKAIEDGTYEVPIEYSKYSPNDAIDQYREARIVGLYPIGTESTQFSHNTQIVSSFVDAYYCLAILDDRSTGVVKLAAQDGKLMGYDRWIIENEEDLEKTKTTLGFSIRGKTTTMPHLNATFNTLHIEKFINDSLSNITLLDTIGTYPDTEKVVPELASLGNSTKFVVLTLVLGIIWGGWDLLKLNAEQKARAAFFAQKTVAPATIVFKDEVARIVSQCNSTAESHPDLVADYALCKLQYLKSKGATEEALQPLIILAYSTSPAYVSQDIEKMIAILETNLTPLIHVAEHFAKQGMFTEAYELTKTLVCHAEKNRRTLIAGKHSFRNSMEEALYRKANGLRGSLNTTSTDYAGLFVLHANLIQLLSQDLPHLHNTEKRYLDMAFVLNNTNAGIYLLRAESCANDPVQWKENICKALEYCCNQDGLYTLARIYLSLGAYYQNRDNAMYNACYAMAIHCGEPETDPGSHSQNSNAANMSLSEVTAILLQNEIPVGYSQLVKDVASSLPDQTGVQHILRNPGGVV